MSLILHIPLQHLNEGKWVASVLLNKFLGIDYQVIYDAEKKFILKSEGRSLEFPNVFLDKACKAWLNKSTLPEQPLELFNVNSVNLDIPLVIEPLPVLFGKPLLDMSSKRIQLGIDIFGSAFFMLSRYEELIVTDRDDHDRFPAIASIAYKENFLNRPIVDEYVELLWACIKYLWPEIKRKKRTAKTFISCDVDTPYSPAIKNWHTALRQVIGDIIKRKSPKRALNSIINIIASKFGNFSYDNYDNFEWIMDVNEDANNIVAFYFITGHSAGAIDGCYSLQEPRITSLIYCIYKRGHEIGLHASYNSYNKQEVITEEVNRLKQKMVDLGIKQKEIGCRQHYLRWQSDKTVRYQYNAGITYDSTLCFADLPGFRCGTCHEFIMYDLKNRCAINIIQRPLVVMESSIISKRYMGFSYSKKSMNAFLSYKETCYRFDGNFCLLWHNSHFNSKEDKSFYLKLIKS